MTVSDYNNDMSTDERVMMAMVRITEAFKRNLSAIFKNYNLTFPQYNVLRVLDASENGRTSMRDIKKTILISRANMTGIARRLEKSGFVTRNADPTDDRIKLLAITPNGRQVIRSIADSKERHIKEYLKYFADMKKLDLLVDLKLILR